MHNHHKPADLTCKLEIYDVKNSEIVHFNPSHDKFCEYESENHVYHVYWEHKYAKIELHHLK